MVNLPPDGANADFMRRIRRHEEPDPDESFADDQLVLEEERRKAMARDRSRARGKSGRRTEQASKAKDQLVKAQEAQRLQDGADAVSRREQALPQRGPKGKRVQEGRSGVSDLVKHEEAIGELMRELKMLEAKLREIQKRDVKGKSKKALEAKQMAMRQLQARGQVAEGRVRFALQQLFAGQFGFILLEDPFLTFRRLFDRLRHWPKRVKPGRRPRTTDEMDAFIAWVFEPPPAPDEDEPVVGMTEEGA